MIAHLEHADTGIGIEVLCYHFWGEVLDVYDLATGESLPIVLAPMPQADIDAFATNHRADVSGD